MGACVFICLIVLILPNVLAFSFVKPAGRRFIVKGDNNIVTGNTIINNGNSGVQTGSTGVCVDDSSCPQILASYDICQMKTAAWKLCPKICKLCTGSGTSSGTSHTSYMTQAPPVNPVPNVKCKDSSPGCPLVKDRYHVCDKSATAKMCQKTCKLC